MFTLRNKMGMAVLAAAVLCGFGAEAQAQIYSVKPDGTVGGTFGSYKMYGATMRITTQYYVYDVYPPAGGGAIRFVQRDRQSLEPVYGGSAELAFDPTLSSATLVLRTNTKYYGNKISGYTTGRYDGPVHQLLVGAPAP